MIGLRLVAPGSIRFTLVVVSLGCQPLRAISLLPGFPPEPRPFYILNGLAGGGGHHRTTARGWWHSFSGAEPSVRGLNSLM